MWRVPTALVIFDKAIARFEKEHPGVKIHYYSGISKDDYSEWFSRKLLAGKEPDVFMVLGTDFNQFSSMGVMKNLEPLMEKTRILKQKNITAVHSGADSTEMCSMHFPMRQFLR